MHIVIDRPHSADYAQAFHRLAGGGSRRFLFWNLSRTVAAELVPQLQAEALGAHVAVTAGDAELPGFASIAAADAFRDAHRWDVVVVCSTNLVDRMHVVRELHRLTRVPELVYPGTRSEHVLVTSLQKSGTHLVAELMKALGYEVVGPHRLYKDPDRLLPFERLARLGPNTCMLTHFLDPWEHDHRNLVHMDAWMETGSPAIMLNYRDPRDAICSFVHYLMGEAKQPFTRLAFHHARAEVLYNIKSPHERLMRAILDKHFSLKEQFESVAWLLDHPRVCQIAFERLVGSEGGGTSEAQIQQTAEIMCHVAVGGSPIEYAKKVFNCNARVFFRGQIGAWRSEFTSEHTKVFNGLFAHIMKLYRYPIEEP